MNDVDSLLPQPQFNKIGKCGILQNYQEKLSTKYQAIIIELEARIQSIVSETNDFLSKSIQNYQKEKEIIRQQQETMIENLPTTDDEFEEIKQNIEINSNKLIDDAVILREECIKKYNESFSELQPIISDSFQSCEDYRMQLPDALIEKLPYIVKRLNKQYLINKKELIERLYLNEIEAREKFEEISNRVDECKENWSNHRVETLVSDAKIKLDYKYPIDFGTIYEAFQKDEQKFIQCFKKNLESIQMLTPPEKFDKENLDTWNRENSEVLQLHTNFIDQFKMKIEDKLHERETVNDELIEDIRDKLLKIRTEEETTEQISWLLPISNLTKKVNTEFLRRLNAYWDNRIESLNGIFIQLYEFYSKLIESYEGFLSSSKDDQVKCKEIIHQFQQETKEKVEELEAKIAANTETINNSVDEKEISNLVQNCQDCLTSIEDQYREFYTKSISFLDERPEVINQFYETRENELLEQLKMNKTSIRQPTGTNNDKGQKDKAKKKENRRLPKAKEKKPLTDEFTFTIENFAIYNENENLELIPEIPAYEDKSLEELQSPTTKKGATKGKKPATRASKRATTATKKSPKKGAKTMKEEPEELEMPELSLFEMVPTINNQLSIEIYIPLNEEVHQYINPLRERVFSELQKNYEAIIQYSQYEDIRSRLAGELNERLRVEAPRLANLELNVGTARLSQLEKTKRDIELHFRQTVTNFNNEYISITKKIDGRTQKLEKDCEKLRKFIDLLGEQKVSRSFNQLQAQFKLEEKKFNQELKEMNDIQNKDIDQMISNYKFVNEKFDQTISTYSEEEKEYCKSMEEKMNAQVEPLFENIKQKVKDDNDKVILQRDSISAEFEEMLPIHKSDIVFSENLIENVKLSKQKYESLLFKNRQAETEVQSAIEKLKEVLSQETAAVDTQKSLNSISSDLNSQSEMKITKQFESLDLVRLLIVKRSMYLGILKSQISSEPILVNIDFSPNDSEETEQTSKKKTSKSKPKTSKKSTKSKNKDSQEIIISIPSSVKDQINQVGESLLDDVKQIATPYYNSLKKRTLGITRTELIPEDLDKCIEKVKNEWSEIIADSNSIISQSSEIVIHQMNESIQVARQAITKIYQSLLSYFLNSAELNEKTLSLNFEKEMQDLLIQRNALKEQLVPNLADSNKEDEFVELMKKENERELEEKKTIDSYVDKITESESQLTRSFLTQLPIVTQYLLDIFDRFVLAEDLREVKLEKAERVSMKQMLLNMKKREESDGTFDENRKAFKKRQWPLLDTAGLQQNMEFITSVPNPRSLDTSSKKGNGKKVPNAFLALKKIQQAFVETVEPPKIEPLESLDTGLSRGAIVEQEKCYEAYQSNYTDRFELYKQKIEEARDRTTQLNQNWRVCSLKLNPNYIFEPI